MMDWFLQDGALFSNFSLKARGSKYKARRLEARNTRLEGSRARGSKARHIEYSIRTFNFGSKQIFVYMMDWFLQDGALFSNFSLSQSIGLYKDVCLNTRDLNFLISQQIFLPTT